MRYIFVFFFLLLYSLFPQFVFAQDTGWIINNYESKIDILESGEVEVLENISVDFYALQKHGIFKDIPYVYVKNSENYYTEVKIIKVELDGSDEKYATYDNGRYIQLKIGDPDETISGQHTYLINYVVRGVILPYDSFDELYWNVTGTWPVSVESVRAIVTLPKNFITQHSCYFGYVGSTKLCDAVSASRSALFSTTSLSPNEEMTVAVGFAKNTVPLLKVFPPKSFTEKILEPNNVFLFTLPIVFGFILVFIYWYKNGRDRWFGNHGYLSDENTKEEIKPIGSHETVVVEYIPPLNLRPAELGVLMDERADTLDVAATIIDLAARGYLTIVEIPKKWLFGSVDYQLNKKKEPDSELLPYEKTLLKRLFDDLRMIKTSELKNTFYKDLNIVKQELYAHVVKRKLFPSDPEKIRTNVVIMGVALTVISAMGVIFIRIFSLQMFFAGLAIFSFFLVFLSRAMPRRTSYGRKIYVRTRGYYEFISHVEKYRQQFFERKNMLNEVLPYVIVFGLTGKFAKALKDMGVKPEKPTWYVGHGTFNVFTFDKNINAFSSSLSSAISSAPRSSGSSGGGFSGGGFGGGGGGSW